MTINHENIEEVMFDYFEGNLDDKDKADLLNFIHQYPEYEKTFASWAQTFVLAESSVPDYQITEKLLNIPKQKWYVKYRTSIFSSAMIAASVAIFLFWNQNSPKPDNTPKRVEIETENINPKTSIQQVEKTNDSQVSLSGIKKNKTRDVKIEKKTLQTNVNESPTNSIQPEISINSEAEPHHKIMHEEALSNTNQKVKQDSFISEVKSDIKQIEETKSTKKKRKKNLNISTSPNFIPTNDNF